MIKVKVKMMLVMIKVNVMMMLVMVKVKIKILLVRVNLIGFPATTQVPARPSP